VDPEVGGSSPPSCTIPSKKLCGCKLLVSLTSAGQITPAGPTPYFVIIDRASRDEGSSHHYAPPSEYAEADPSLVTLAAAAVTRQGRRFSVGSSWTTDAPFRETADAIEAARSKGVLAVEMEAAALYTFARKAGVSGRHRGRAGRA
jgi:uridine phosphorylase